MGVLFKENLKLINPISPAVNDESKIINFALLIIVSLSKASKVIKIDIVKPIPAKKPTPKIVFHDKSCGSLQNPNFTATKDKRKIPRGFPAIRPSAIPKL